MNEMNNSLMCGIEIAIVIFAIALFIFFRRRKEKVIRTLISSKLKPKEKLLGFFIGDTKGSSTTATIVFGVAGGLISGMGGKKVYFGLTDQRVILVFPSPEQVEFISRVDIEKIDFHPDPMTSSVNIYTKEGQISIFTKDSRMKRKAMILVNEFTQNE